MTPRGRQGDLPPAMYEWPKDRAWDVRVRCEDCRFFVPDTKNPTSGIGSCEQGLIGFYPMAPHYCRTFKSRTP